MTSVSNITGKFRTIEGKLLPTGNSIVCEVANNIENDIKSATIAVDHVINTISNDVNSVVNTITSEINTVISTAIHYENEALNYVQNVVFGIESTVSNVIYSIDHINFCGMFDVSLLPNTVAGVSEYYTIPNVGQAVNFLNPTSGNVIRPLPSMNDQLIGQSQVHRLSRATELNHTIVQHKSSHRERFIPGPFYSSAWAEPASSYNAVYPHNKVMQTRNGIIIEHDDTPGAVRIHNYHPSGSYNEISNSGRKVDKTVDDSFEIVLKDKKLYVKGKFDITIDGATNVKIGGNVNLDVDGNVQAAIRNDLTAVVSGNTLLNTSNNTLIKSDKIQFESNNFNVNSNNITFNSKNFDTNSNNIIVNTKEYGIRSTDYTVAAAHLYLNSDDIESPSMWYDSDPPSPPLLKLGGIKAKTVNDANTVINSELTPPKYKAKRVADKVTSNTAHTNNPYNNYVIKQLIYFDDGQTEFPTPLQYIHVPDSYLPSKYKSQQVSNPAAGVAPIIIDTNTITDNLPLTLVLSKYCTLGNLTKYCTVTHEFITQAISTKSRITIVKNLTYLAQNVIDPVYDAYGRGAVEIACAFRALNTSYVSDHELGMAVDLQFNDINNENYYKRIQDLGKIIPYDKMIFCWAWNGSEYCLWVHISLIPYQAPGYRVFSYDMSHQQYNKGLINPFVPINISSKRTDGIVND